MGETGESLSLISTTTESPISNSASLLITTIAMHQGRAEEHRPGKTRYPTFLTILLIFPTTRAAMGTKTNNQIWGHLTFRRESNCLCPPCGCPRWSQRKFSTGHRLMATWVYNSSGTRYGGPWKNAQPGYLGLKFFIKGKVHYGWARLRRPLGRNLGYGDWLRSYETIPGKAIITGATKGPDNPEPTASFSMPNPEPATLGALAMGARGLSIWRRKESALQGN